MRHAQLFSFLGLVAFATPAMAAPSYNIHFERSGYGQQYNATQATPFSHAASYPVPGTVNCTLASSLRHEEPIRT